MAENAFVKIGTALLKHQVKKLVGEETLGVISEELADIGGDKLDAWLGDKSTIAEIEKAATTARDSFREKVGDVELEQYMHDLPLHNLPKVLEAIEELPTSPNEIKLENALREAITRDWKNLSPEQVDHAVNAFMSCLRSALLPIEKQGLMVIGRAVLRIEEKTDHIDQKAEKIDKTTERIEDKLDQLAKRVAQLKPYSTEALAESRFGDITIGGNVDGNIVVGDNNVVNNIINNYYPVIEKNIEKHEPDYWALKHPYPMPPNFTGRIAERAMLTHWLKEDSENRLFILRALGGFGKSALTWQWLTHDVDIKEYPKVVFWSFYEGDASFEHFIEETLKYLNIQVPQGQRPQVDELLKAMGSQKILLIMDGFERALRAYSSMNAAYQGDEPKVEDNQLDCVNINAEIFLKSVCSLPNIKSKVLMTTRLTPHAVKPRGEFMLGCREVELTSMQPADAVEFFHKQKIKGTHAEIEAACAPYGYHPLSLRLLAGRILKDFENPADMVVAQKLKIDGDIIQQKHHVLEVSYNSLSPHEQKLLSTIACFRSPVELKTLQSIAENKDTLDDDLHDLVARGLLHFDEKNKKFDLHPIVRLYAYERLTAPDRIMTHKRLRDYFAPIDVPNKPQILDDLAPVIELYHHTIHTGSHDSAFKIYNERLRSPLYYQLGAYELDLQLLLAIPRSGNGIPHLSSTSYQTWNLYYATLCCERTGRLELGLNIVQQVVNLNQTTQGSRHDLGSAQGTFAILSSDVGNLKVANTAIAESVEIFDSLDDPNWRGISHRGYGRILSLCGSFEKAEKEFEIARSAYNINDRFQHGLSVLSIYKGQSYLWQMKPEEALECAKQARQTSGQNYLRENISADWLAGISLIELFSQGRIKNKSGQVRIENYLTSALIRCRSVNLVELEPDILLAWARWNRICGYSEKALKDAEDAFGIAKRCGYRLKQADICILLSHLALDLNNFEKAHRYAEEAKKLATCDGPPYCYKVAYEEAERLLEKLK